MNQYRICKVCQQKTDKQICPVCGGTDFSEDTPETTAEKTGKKFSTRTCVRCGLRTNKSRCPVCNGTEFTGTLPTELPELSPEIIKGIPRLACVKCGQPVWGGRCDACGFELRSEPFAMLSVFSPDRMGSSSVIGARMTPAIKNVAENTPKVTSDCKRVPEINVPANQPSTAEKCKQDAASVYKRLTELLNQTKEYYVFRNYTAREFEQHKLHVATFNRDYRSLSEQEKKEVAPVVPVLFQFTRVLDLRNRVDDLLYSMLFCYYLAEVAGKVAGSDYTEEIIQPPVRVSVNYREWKKRRNACIAQMKLIQAEIQGLSESDKTAFRGLDPEEKHEEAFAEFSGDDSFEKCAGKFDRFLEYVKYR